MLERKKIWTDRLFSLLPILHWLPRYKWREYLHGDVVAGLTVGVMHVPQGMAYASLAGVPPVYGMYSSFFAALWYMIFGTARHISIGVFAVSSMMVGACRFRLAPDPNDIGNGTFPLGREVDPLVLTSSLTLLVGCIQIILGIMRLGFLTTYLSDTLVSGFTTGAAVHVLMSQLNKVFGVNLSRHEGAGMLIKMLWDIILSIPQINWAAFGLSVAGISFLWIGRTYFSPIIKKYLSIPAPLELILVIIGVVLSITFDLKKNFKVKVVDNVPTGFPTPSLPDISLFPYLLADAFPIAVICYMFVISMGKVFAKKHQYKTDPTQELYAVGLMSVLSSPFPVYPVGASLSRSSVCEMAGANTQFYTLFSSILLLLTFLFIGHFLEPLPMCILACIVIVSLFSLFIQVKELPRLWRVSKFDCAIWIISASATILTDVTRGLIISVFCAIFSIILREQWAKLTLISSTGRVPPQHIPENVKIVKWEAPLHFANVTRFFDMVTALLGKEESLLQDTFVVLDCSAITYIDIMGIDNISKLYADAQRKNTVIFMTNLNSKVKNVLLSADGCGGNVPFSAFRETSDEALLHIATL